MFSKLKPLNVKGTFSPSEYFFFRIVDFESYWPNTLTIICSFPFPLSFPTLRAPFLAPSPTTLLSIPYSDSLITALHHQTLFQASSLPNRHTLPKPTCIRFLTRHILCLSLPPICGPQNFTYPLM